jgi:hypothetical protein
MAASIISMDGGTLTRRDRARRIETPRPAQAEIDRSIRIHV